jgi:hypothetical protein
VSPTSGDSPTAMAVYLETNNEAASIYYTTDGSEPTLSSASVANSWYISLSSGNTALRAVALYFDTTTLLYVRSTVFSGAYNPQGRNALCWRSVSTQFS